MTLDEFFAELEKTPRDWYIAPYTTGLIRRVPDDLSGLQCPLSALLGCDANSIRASQVRQLGLSMPTAHRIADEADGLAQGPIRARLLKACGLAELHV